MPPWSLAKANQETCHKTKEKIGFEKNCCCNHRKKPFKDTSSFFTNADAHGWGCRGCDDTKMDKRHASPWLVNSHHSERVRTAWRDVMTNPAAGCIAGPVSFVVLLLSLEQTQKLCPREASRQPHWVSGGRDANLIKLSGSWLEENKDLPLLSASLGNKRRCRAEGTAPADAEVRNTNQTGLSSGRRHAWGWLRLDLHVSYLVTSVPFVLKDDSAGRSFLWT